MNRDELTVGQKVWIYDVNGRGREPEWATVTRVGRSLFDVEIDFGTYARTEQYRLDGGHLNDVYGHRYVLTDDQRADRERRAPALAAINATRWSDMDTDTLVKIAAVLPS